MSETETSLMQYRHRLMQWERELEINENHQAELAPRAISFLKQEMERLWPGSTELES